MDVEAKMLLKQSLNSCAGKHFEEKGRKKGNKEERKKEKEKEGKEKGNKEGGRAFIFSLWLGTGLI